MPNERIITLTTDFGYDDPFVGVMKGVILKINPQATVVDLTHGIKPQDIREAAFAIGTHYNYFPDNTIHVVVVDPGVGSKRRPIAVMADRHYFIGPDNGVFSVVYNGGHEILDVFHLTATHYFLSSPAPTFHGRDIFASTAGWLSKGIEISKFGDQIGDYHKVRLPVPAVTAEGMLKGEVIHIDRFGNAMTNVKVTDLDRFRGTKPGGSVKIVVKGKEVPLKTFYAEAAENQLCALINSSGYLELFLNGGNAAASYAISAGLMFGIIVV
jgi:S-adenosylmethionine hydrolase